MAKLLLMSSEINLSDLINSTVGLLAVYKCYNNELKELIEAGAIKTWMTDEVDDYAWIQGQKQMTFASNFVQLSSGEIETQMDLVKATKMETIEYNKFFNFFKVGCCKRLGDKIKEIQQLKAFEKTKVRPVEIKVYDVQFLHGQMNDIYKYVSTQKDQTIFDDPLIKAMLVSQDYSKNMYWFLAIYLIYIMLTLYYFYGILTYVEEKTWFWAIRIPIFLLILYNYSIEYHQLKLK